MIDNTQMFAKKNRPLKIEDSSKMEEDGSYAVKNVANLNNFINDAEHDYFFG
jgi:hypothetical protein